LNCKGCYVPQLHSKEAGTLIPVKMLAELLLDPKFERDGVSILGGEPFAQPEGLFALVRELRLKNCPHIVCYSGYTLEQLREKSIKQPAIGTVLGEIDILIDGAYVESLASSAGLWTGSGNQRVIDINETKRSGEIVLI
jgi:anaerobic ribonucleoside-triphosphate reductase activating protein